jgi:hypothetical protein
MERGERKETDRERMIRYRKRQNLRERTIGEGGKKLEGRRQKHLQEEKKTEAERKEPWEGYRKL